MGRILINVHEIEKSFASKTLFQGISFGIEEGQRVGLLGPNGAGKSTLLRILAGLDTTDRGQVTAARSLRLGYLAQVPQFKKGETIWDAVLSGSRDPSEPDCMTLASELIARLELDGVDLGPDRLVEELSGGWKKRVALARELVKEPDLFLLDEPTNHLDLESILWLEDELLRNSQRSLLLVTHDRLFLQKTCSIIMDLDPRLPQGLLRFDGPYSEFLEHKSSLLAAQRKLESVRANQLRSETEWLRRGSIARQTKQQARIDRAYELADEVKDLKNRNRDRLLNFEFAELEKSPKRVIEAKNLGQSFDGKVIFRGLNLKVGRGAKIGIVGRNGAGKTTMLRTLIGELTPSEGTVFRAEGLKVAYFEQQKRELQQDATVLQTLVSEGDYVHVQGQPVYAKSYLHRFHFTSQQMDLPVKQLSGGEQSRLMIAKLLLQTEPILILDEPTNDLDIETLDVLQEALEDFPGVLFVVSHDRFFLDHICNQILAVTPTGDVESFADVFQWEEWVRGSSAKGRRSASRAAEALRSAPEAGTGGVGAGSAKGPQKIKLSYNEQREWTQIDDLIAKAEARVVDLQSRLRDPEIQSKFSEIQKLSVELSEAENQRDHLYSRWETLAAKVEGS